MASSKRIGTENCEFLIQETQALQPYNTLAVAVNARYFCQANSLAELRLALTFARERVLPVLVLGEGSNTVFTQDFDGLVVLNRLRGIELLSDDDESVSIQVAAGENWHEFVDHCLHNNWFGLENLALIPGLVGAAPIQNIGAYGVEVKDTISRVSYLDLASDSGNDERHTISNQQCQFEYRDSIFKHQLSGKIAITSVEFRLSKTPALRLAYPALANEFDSPPSPRDIFNRVCEVRSAKLPMPKDIPNAGSFFKNPIISKKQFETLKRAHPGIVGFGVGHDIKLAAAWLIEQRGWKQKSVAGVKVHQHQALVVTNPEHKTGKEILRLAQAIQDDVKRVFNVSLEIEPKIY